MNIKKVNIFAYTGYQLYLKDYCAAQKKLNKKFTFKSFSESAGVATSLIKDIIKGRRNLTLAVMEKYAEAMKLSNREARYFKILVNFTNSSTNEEKNRYFQDIIHSRRNLSLKRLDESQYQFYSEWYHSVIREIITLECFQEDPEWISRKLQPQVTPGKVKKSLELLQELNIIKRDDSGKLVQCDEVISSPAELQSMVLRNFGSSMIKLALEAQENVPLEKREISGLTLGVSEECYSKIKSRIRDFKEELLDLVQKDEAESSLVCRVNYQLFPMVSEESKS